MEEELLKLVTEYLKEEGVCRSFIVKDEELMIYEPYLREYRLLVICTRGKNIIAYDANSGRQNVFSVDEPDSFQRVRNWVYDNTVGTLPWMARKS